MAFEHRIGKYAITCWLFSRLLAALAGQTGLQITVCHFPPGTQCRCLTF